MFHIMLWIPVSLLCHILQKFRPKKSKYIPENTDTAMEIKMMKTKDLALIFYQYQRLSQDGLLQAQKHFTHLSNIYSLPTMYQV